MNNRSFGLDALRGFAILTMFLSGLVPFYKNTLPPWMYHIQVPPPLHKFNPEIYGISWVDLVFPFFIFAMGAAIPLALNKQLKKGIPKKKIILQIVERFFLLAGFAIYIQHVKPYAISSEPDLHVCIVSLIGFILLFPVLYRLPKEYTSKRSLLIRILGFIGVISILLYIQFVFDKTFSLNRSDIIILVLSNIYLVGSILWLFTPKNLLARFSVFGVLLALRLGHSEGSIPGFIWNISPAPWLFNVYFLQYLFILIPGTLIGDYIIGNNEKCESTGKYGKSFYLYALQMFLFTPLVLFGLYSRLVTETFVVVILLLAVSYFTLKRIDSETKSFLIKLFLPGAFFLLLGLLLEPYEGGIRKDSATLSYYFVTGGLAIFALSFFTMLIDYLGRKEFNLLVYNGQNPMIAYAGISNLIPPLLGITHVGVLLDLLVISPWMGFIKGLLVMLLLGVIVMVFTKRKIFLRA